MLVLSRKCGEKVYVGDDITFTIVEAHKNRVRIGIEAPAGVTILRAELMAPPDTAAAGRGCTTGAAPHPAARRQPAACPRPRSAPPRRKSLNESAPAPELSADKSDHGGAAIAAPDGTAT